jgi:hypothetical protein
MNTRNYLLISILILAISFSCTRNSGIVRNLDYVDLLTPENEGFHRYPSEFSTQLLKGVLDGRIQAYDIDYDSSGLISVLDLNLFAERVLEPYTTYTPSESTVADDLKLEDASQFLSSVTLIGLDYVSMNGDSTVKYINFYNPLPLIIWKSQIHPCFGTITSWQNGVGTIIICFI